MMRQISLSAAFAFSLFLHHSTVLAATEWTGWLGPERNGWVEGFQPPAQWPDQLQHIWQVPVGMGYGTPLVSGDRIYQHARQGEEEVLWCLSLKTGDTIWRTPTEVPFKMGGGGESHGKGPKSNPTLAHGRIFTMSITGVLSVFDSSTGESLWQRDFVIVGGENRGIRSVRPELNNGVWSVNERWNQKKLALDMSSAVINGNHLYGFSHYRLGQLFCLDTETGDIVWEGPGRSGDNATFLSIPDHIIALLDNGQLQVIAAGGKEFKKVASYTVAESPTWAAPVLLENGILIKDRDSLTYWSLNKEATASQAPAR